MLDDTFRKIESRVEKTDALNAENKAELLGLISTLKTEVSELSRTNLEQAQSIAGFTEVSTHEATRSEKRPESLKHALDGLASAADGFEQAHPRLMDIVNRISMLLSNMGI